VRQPQAADKVGPGGRPDLSPQQARQSLHGSQRIDVRHLDHAIDDGTDETGFHARPANALNARTGAGQAGVAGAVIFGKDRADRVRHAQLAGVALVAYKTPYGGASAASTRAHHNPARNGIALMRHLAEHALGNVVVAAPVSRALGVGELVHVMAAGPRRKLAGFVMHLNGVIHPMAASAVKLDLRDLFRRSIAWHHGNEGKVEQPRKVGFTYGC